MGFIWEDYESRRTIIGRSKHDKRVEHTRLSMKRRMLDSPSCRMVKINGKDQVVMIVHKAELNQKKIFSLPGEHLVHGGIVDFCDSKWLICEMDGDNIIYDKAIMKRCNHVLRWINKDGELIERWCVVEDGTKYLIGEKQKQFITIGDARIAVTLAKDVETMRLERGARFIVDDPDADEKLVYEITKSNRMYNMYDGIGVYRYILHECTLEDGDNISQGIANYKDWEPPRITDGDHKDSLQTIVEIVEEAKHKAESGNEGMWL